MPNASQSADRDGRPAWTAKIRTLASTYPVVAVAVIGIVAGGITYPLKPAYAHFLFACVAVAGGIPLVWSTVKNVARRKYNVDAIASVAIIASVALGQYLAGSLVVLMQSGGEALEEYGLRRANRSLDSLLRRAPSTAHRQDGDSFVDVPAAALQVGDIILVKPGDIIAADGTVTDGVGNVDEAALTGEPIPLAKRAGDTVYSGTVNLSGSLIVRTTSTAAQSKYELIVRMVQQAQGERAPIARLANRYTPAFMALTFGITMAVLAVTHDFVRALAVLVVATPCPLIIATPLAVLSGINRAAAMNIICKGGAPLEQAAGVTTVVFDKTGTLTTGEPTLDRVEVITSDIDERQILSYAASVEIFSTHVIAAAVVRAARDRCIDIPAARDAVEEPGTGIAGSIGNHAVAVGSERFMTKQEVQIDETTRARRVELSKSGSAVSIVAIDGRIVALLVFEDRIRPEATMAVRRLAELGVVRSIMLTGDAAEAADHVGHSVGIHDIRSQMRPEDKMDAIRQLCAKEPTMMVGDGINDAPALTTSTVGIAMGSHGAGIATDAADIVITVDDVGRVADTIAIGRRMMRIAKQGIWLGIGISFFLMILASIGYIKPAIGALAQEGLDLLVILNALRVR